MIFTTMPDNYAPITAPIMFGFDLGEERNFVDVNIVDVANEQILGVKRLYNVQSAEIDVVPYLNRCFVVNPIEGGTSLVNAKGLYAAVAIEVDGCRSDRRHFSHYPVEEGVATLFRPSLKRQNIARTESDYMVIYSPCGGKVDLELYADSALVDTLEFDIEENPGLSVLKIVPSDFPKECDSMVLAISIEGVDYYVSYQIVPQPERSKRLMWVDQDGVLQFYTFPICRSRRYRATKQRVETAQGVMVISSESELSLVLVSDYETVADIELIGEIIASKQVWVDCGNRATKVDVLSSESVVKYGGALNMVQIEIRPQNGKEAEL